MARGCLKGVGRLIEVKTTEKLSPDSDYRLPNRGGRLIGRLKGVRLYKKNWYFG